MDFAFEAIGIELPNERAYQRLVRDVGKRGEVSELRRNDGTLHGRCLKFGKGLEVWTMLYEAEPGELLYADCRPGFRGRRRHKVGPWLMTEVAEEGAAVVHGFIEDTEVEVLFELQNLTEVGTRALSSATLTVGLCGLASSAEVVDEPLDASWQSYDELSLSVVEKENDWRLTGKIIALEALRNPQSGSDLFWFLVEIGELQLEIVVNQRMLDGSRIAIGSYIKADVWLQGHIVPEPKQSNGYEGIDWTVRPSDHWFALRRPN